MHITAPFDPKSLKLSWITGTSFGLTPFWSDSVDYVACAIPVRDVTDINIVNPHWDNTTWVYRHQGISSQEVSSLCLMTYNDSLPIHITKCKVIILRFILKLHQDDVHNLKGANTDREGGKNQMFHCIGSERERERDDWSKLFLYLSKEVRHESIWLFLYLSKEVRHESIWKFMPCSWWVE